MTSLICIVYLVLITTQSLCWPQEPVLQDISTTPLYEYDNGGGETLNYVTPKGDYGVDDYDDGDYNDYGYYDDDYTSKEQYDEYEYYGDYFTYGDRKNPADSGLAIAETNGMIPGMQQVPWVYIIVPVIQVDVFYVDANDKVMEDIDLRFPIETYFFEMGDFGMAHLDMGDYGLACGAHGGGEEDGSSEEDDHSPTDYPQYDVMAEHYDTAGDLDNANIMEYPGIDHDSSWIDWIFMIPPGQIIG